MTMPKKRKIQATDVINADEASSWLKIPKSTLYKLCNDGDLPAAKVGRHWRFHRETLEKWFLDKTQHPKSDTRLEE
jgi:excisionase family DNA binding protein